MGSFSVIDFHWEVLLKIVKDQHRIKQKYSNNIELLTKSNNTEDVISLGRSFVEVIQCVANKLISYTMIMTKSYIYNTLVTNYYAYSKLGKDTEVEASLQIGEEILLGFHKMMKSFFNEELTRGENLLQVEYSKNTLAPKL